jgi:hypothetical protein
VDTPEDAWASLVRRGVLDPDGFVWPRRTAKVAVPGRAPHSDEA